MSNTNQNFPISQFELERLSRILAELKEIYTQKKKFNDRLEVTLMASSSTICNIDEITGKAISLHNQLIDSYAKFNSSLSPGGAEKKNKEEEESKMLDEQIAIAQAEKTRLAARLEQLNLNEAESQKTIEDLRANIKQLEAEKACVRGNSDAKKEKKSEKWKSVSTLELDSSQENLTQSEERLMDIQGMEQASFLDQYFADIKIKREPDSE